MERIWRKGYFPRKRKYFFDLGAGSSGMFSARSMKGNGISRKGGESMKKRLRGKEMITSSRTIMERRIKIKTDLTRWTI